MTTPRTTPALDWLLSCRIGILQALPHASSEQGSGSESYLSKRDDWLIKLQGLERFLVDAERDLIEAHPSILPPSARCHLEIWQVGLLEDLVKNGSLVRLENQDDLWWRPLGDNRPIDAQTVDSMIRRQLVELVDGVVVLTRRGRQRAILGETL